MNKVKKLEGPALNTSALLALALVSGAIIAYELFVMRIFANGGWSHFGSTVVSIAMFGFGVFSTVLCIWKGLFTRRLSLWLNVSLLALGPAMTLANTLAQRIDFNPIFLASDPSQKYHLASYFLLYFFPFLLGAMFLGLFFILAQKNFGKAYFANMTGSGLGGLVLFGAMYLFLPERLFIIPILLWMVGSALWMINQKKFSWLLGLLAASAAALTVGYTFEQINVSDYKGVSYARKFPDSRLVHQSVSPFGRLEVYSSSYFHFAPGLSDTAALYLDEMPQKAFLGMYIDGDGPIGVMKDIPPEQTEYIRFLPMAMPYLLKKDPKVLIMQFGGGISTNAALELGVKELVVAEGNPMIVRTVRDNEEIADFTGRILENPKVKLVPYDGRIFVHRAKGGFDIVDLSLADSTGLSMPGGFSIHEKFTYTTETFQACIEALKDGGIFAVTVWNKEDPPKSTLKLLTTMVDAAAKETPQRDVARDFFVAHTYLSTLSVNYKKGGFTAEEVEALKKYCRKMNFDILHYPGQPEVKGDLEAVLVAYRNLYFAPQENENLSDDFDMSAGSLYRLALAAILEGRTGFVQDNYIFNVRPLTNNRPYFAGFVKLGDLPGFFNQLEAISDEWGYLLLWATLAMSIGFGLILMILPVVFGWRAVFSKHRGKLGIFIYFMCLGFGYILVEIGLISKYILALGNPTVSISVLITGMLVFSGVGSYFSSRFVPSAGRAMTVICIGIVLVLLAYTLLLNPLLGLIGLWPYWAKILFCLALLFPPAFLMGFPFALGMSTLSNLGKEVFFVWAWGINGSFSVAGSVLVPILSVLWGISSAIIIAAALYLIALVAFFQLQLPAGPTAEV